MPPEYSMDLVRWQCCSCVQFELNGGVPVASSIPATEHSVMTAWPSEREAIENMIEHYGTGLFSVVMDSYDYAAVRLGCLQQEHTALWHLHHRMIGIALCLMMLVVQVWYLFLQALNEVLPSIASKQVHVLVCALGTAHRIPHSLHGGILSTHLEQNALWMRYEHCVELQVGAGGFMVLRPDSGDPVEAVLMALRAAEKVMHNSK